MKILRILSLAAAAFGFVSLGACKSKDTSYTAPPTADSGSYYSGK